MLNLAGTLATGQVVKADAAQSKTWYLKAQKTFEQAAAAGDADAMLGLVTMFRSKEAASRSDPGLVSEGGCPGPGGRHVAY
jgi:hypothetical protein